MDNDWEPDDSYSASDPGTSDAPWYWQLVEAAIDGVREAIDDLTEEERQELLAKIGQAARVRVSAAASWLWSAVARAEG